MMLEKTNPALDEKWFAEFNEAGNFLSHLFLDVENLVEEKTAFLAGKQNPEFEYARINLAELAAREEKLLALKQKILAGEKNENVRQAYRWKINEKIAELKMLQAAGRGEMTPFKKYSEFAFGKPDKNIFAHVIDDLKNEIEETAATANPDLQTAAVELASALSRFVCVDKSDYIIPSPTAEEYKRVRDHIREYFREIIECRDPNQQEFDAAEIKKAFDAALAEISADEWQTVIDPKRLVVSIHGAKNEVIVPTDKKVDERKMESLLAHEIGLHVARVIGGHNSKLKLLSVGLDRDLAGYEGPAALASQTLEQPENFDGFAGRELHLALGFATGCDGQPRDFRSTFEILKKYFYFKCLQKGEPKNVAAQKSENEAWLKTVRVFRGSDCKTPGCCFTKDLAYLEGNISSWRYLLEDENALARLSIGRYDYFNERHLKILTNLGIISEKDL